MSDTTVTIGRSQVGPLRLDVPKLIGTRAFITASSGGGKSYLLRRLIEQIIKFVQVIIIDPEGEFSSLREKFPLLLVGAGGEAAADYRAAPLLARKLMELKLSAVIDLYDIDDVDQREDLETVDKRRAYGAAFLGALMRLPRDLYHPVVVVIDEAHIFAPKSEGGTRADTPGGQSRRAVVALTSAGRKRGLCTVMATQRISKIHNDAIADLKNRFIGGITLDSDQLRAADELGISKAERLTLRDLEPGQFYTFGPAIIGHGVQQFVTDPVVTTHPEAGQQHLSAAPPTPEAIKTLAQALADLPKEVQAETDQLAHAQRRVIELERELRAKPAPAQLPLAAAPVIQKVEVTVFRDGEVGRLEMAIGLLSQSTDALLNAGRTIQSVADGALPAALTEVTQALRAAASKHNVPVPTAAPARKPDQVGPARPASVQIRTPTPARSPAAAGDVKLNPGERLILEALIQYTAGLRREQLTVLTGYKRSSRDTYIQRLTQKGYVATEGGRLVATAEGIAALPDAEPLPRGQALQEFWLGRLPSGERSILAVLIEHHPDAVDKNALGEATGYMRSSRDTYLQRLKAKELVTDAGRGQVRASGDLFGE